MFNISRPFAIIMYSLPFLAYCGVKFQFSNIIAFGDDQHEWSQFDRCQKAQLITLKTANVLAPNLMPTRLSQGQYGLSSLRGEK